MDLVLHEDFGLGGQGGQGGLDLDSQVERFITSSQYRLYILNMMEHYLQMLCEADYPKYQLYRLKYVQKHRQAQIAETLGINKNTVTAWAMAVRDGLLDELDECGIYPANIYRFRQRYRDIGKKKTTN